MITDNLDNFIFSLTSQIPLDFSNLELDHFGYQTSSREDYESLKNQLSLTEELVSENIVSDRRVGIFRFRNKYKCLNYDILGFELVEPKKEQFCKSELDHLEFVIPCSFDEFLDQHSELEWDLSAKDRTEFPKISIKCNDGKSIKFHTKNIFDEIPSLIS